MRLRCVPVSATLSARGEHGLSDRMVAHVEACRRCREELTGHRRLADGMRDLRSTIHAAPSGTYPRVMADIGPWAVPDPDPAPSRRLQVAAAAVATAAATAAAGTAVVLRIARQRAA